MGLKGSVGTAIVAAKLGLPEPTQLPSVLLITATPFTAQIAEPCDVHVQVAKEC